MPALWSAVVKPGQSVSVIPQSDLVITNAALGAELADSTGRTSIKLTYMRPVKITPKDEDEEDGGDEGDNEGDNEGNNEGNNEGVNEGNNEGDNEGDNEGNNEGDNEGNNEGDNEGDDEGDNESDDEGDDEAAHVETVLCSFTPGKIEQCTLNLMFEEDDEFLLEVIGKNEIHLSGNYIGRVTIELKKGGRLVDGD